MIQTLSQWHHPWRYPESRCSPRARTIVKLAVGLLEVDDVETVGDSGPHAAHLEVKPLLVLGAVHIRVDQQVVLKPAEAGARSEG